MLEEVGQALGRETRAKECGMLLGPMVNLHRIPAGGRNYETFSEDPVLTARLAAALVRGIQGEGTGACVKSFLCNNQQTAQKTTSSEVDEKTLENLYLRVYELILEEVTPWAMMTSYNPMNGKRPSDSAWWLKEVLRKQLGFEGMIISDWSAVGGLDALHSTLDIEMPGPPKILCIENLKTAIEEGSLAMEEVDRRAERILGLHLKVAAARNGDIDCSPPELNSSRHASIARRAAEQSIVLLQNETQTHQLELTKLRTIALIGPNAATARIGGGGSASVLAPYAVSPRQGLEAFVKGRAEILYAEGCALDGDSSAIPSEAFVTESKPEATPGLHARYYSVDAFHEGAEAEATLIDLQLDFSWGWAAPAENVPRVHFAARWQGCLRRPSTNEVTLTLLAYEGVARVWIRGELVLDYWSGFDRNNFEERYQNRTASFDLDFGDEPLVPIMIEYEKTGTQAGLRLAWRASDAPDTVHAAAELAAKADCAIVVGGLSNMHEGGGHDRESFALPGRQNELISAVARANPKTIVVLYNGTPVSIRDWRDSVPAILEAFYPGQEGGNALARILFGEVNPSGRLPDTHPRSWEEVEAMKHFPGRDGKTVYAEGAMIGYRDYDARDIEPEFPFGFGLSYTDFAWGRPQVEEAHPSNSESQKRIQIEITNTGDRVGHEVVQLYRERVEPKAGQPLRELHDFAKVELAPGETTTVSFPLPASGSDPKAERFRYRLGRHSRDLKG